MAKSRKSAKAASGSNELVTWALHGLEQLIESTRERLRELETHARKLRGEGKATVAAPSAASTAGAPKARKKRKLSADARRRIAEAQKRRWAKVRATKG